KYFSAVARSSTPLRSGAICDELAALVTMREAGRASLAGFLRTVGSEGFLLAGSGAADSAVSFLGGVGGGCSARLAVAGAGGIILEGAASAPDVPDIALVPRQDIYTSNTRSTPKTTPT